MNGNHENSFVTTVSWLMFCVMIFAIFKLFLNKKKQLNLKKEEENILNSFKETLSSEAVTIFRHIYKNFHPNQIDYISENTTENFFASIKESVLWTSDFREVNIKSVNTEVKEVVNDANVFTATVVFNSVINELLDNNVTEVTSNELWKLKLINNKWLIADIKAIAPQVVKKFDVKKEKLQSNNIEEINIGEYKL